MNKLQDGDEDSTQAVPQQEEQIADTPVRTDKVLQSCSHRDETGLPTRALRDTGLSTRRYRGKLDGPQPGAGLWLGGREMKRLGLFTQLRHQLEKKQLKSRKRIYGTWLSWEDEGGRCLSTSVEYKLPV